jgi:outer membrane protein assembly factor BamB
VFDVANGHQIYQQRLAVGEVFSASPVAAAGHVYFTSEDGEVFVVRAGRRFELVSTNPMGEVIFATPAVVEGGLIFRTLSQLLLIG